MPEYLDAFLAYLRLNRNASPHTVHAYGSDLRQWFAFAATRVGKSASDLTTGDLDSVGLHAFLSELHRRGNRA